VRVALDEQIFAIQPYGGISRMFAELAAQFVRGNPPGIHLNTFQSPIVNRYVLDDQPLAGALAARTARSPWTALGAYFAKVTPRTPADVVHNTFYLPHGLATHRSAKRIVTVHDMIPELMPRTRRRLDFLTLKQRYVESADQVICVSESTKQDLLKVYGLIRAPIHVIHHGVNPRFTPEAPRVDFLPERYVLFVGHRHQYKDADVLFKAFAKVAEKDSDIQLLCVGGNGLSARESTLLEELGIRSRVSQRFLSDELMAAAYAHAAVFVFPSHFEGFGLPALEAMASGTPTILARASSLPEVGGDASLYFEPGAAGELADVIGEVLKDSGTRDVLVSRGLERARSFSWETAARKTAAVYEEALG
jgi:glycosyltransferase involved in cell wall biosynthesis